MSSRVSCPMCGLDLNTHVLVRHLNKSRCVSRRAAAALFDLCIHPVVFRFQAKSDHAAEALRLFGLDVQLYRTKARLGEDSGNGFEAWTTEEGVALALTIEEAARLLGLSYPEAARRLHEHQELLGPFGTAWRLGRGAVSGDPQDDAVMLELLQPINYIIGSDGKRRPRTFQVRW